VDEVCAELDVIDTALALAYATARKLEAELKVPLEERRAKALLARDGVGRAATAHAARHLGAEHGAEPSSKAEPDEPQKGA
jgi:hypothetical protein